MAVQERLRSAGYNAKLRECSDRFEVYINHGEIKNHPELTARTCEVLRKMLDEALNEGNKKRTQRILRAMKNLNCPAQGPTGLNLPT